MVKIADHDGKDDNGYSKEMNSQPCHLGIFIFSHSKRFMNDVKEVIDSKTTKFTIMILIVYMFTKTFITFYKIKV